MMDNQDIKLSVIVPIYNVEQYLRECLDSVLAQGLSCPYEVLLVNDGSQDSSRDIAMEYVVRHKGVFHLIDQENKGLSAARNSGLEKAVGEYILFLDSDDCLVPGALEDIFDDVTRSKVDVYVGNFLHFGELASVEKNNSFIVSEKCSGEEFLKMSLSEKKYMPAVWFKFYRAEFLQLNSFEFVPGLINEDQLFTIQVLLAANSVKATDNVFYKYRHRGGSISKRKSAQAAIFRFKSDSFTVESVSKILKKIEDRQLVTLIALKMAKLLGASYLNLRSHRVGTNEEVELAVEKAMRLKLPTYISPQRFSHLLDKFLMQLDFRIYARLRC